MSAPARIGVDRNNQSAHLDASRLPSVRVGRELGRNAVEDIRKRRRFTSNGPANEQVAPARPVINGKNREPMQGFWIRGRTVSGGSDDFGRVDNAIPHHIDGKRNNRFGGHSCWGGLSGRRQGSPDAALVDVRWRSSRAERPQAGFGKRGLRLERCSCRRRRWRGRNDGA